VTAVHGRSPLLALRLLTPRLELRLPAADELPRFAQVARSGVHARHEMPFLVTWTDHLDSPSFVDDFVGYHLALRSRWTPEDWRLELGAWREGAPIGMQVIHAKDFRRERTTFSGSWLAQSFQRNGYGTEMRAAILELAFTGLGAVAAGSGALEGNVASARVSAKLGYTGRSPERQRRPPPNGPTARSAPVFAAIRRSNAVPSGGSCRRPQRGQNISASGSIEASSIRHR
jgi:RimJ/RimL family protein N-acetyltransferase